MRIESAGDETALAEERRPIARLFVCEKEENWDEN